ncbi:MAG: homoserine kinase [Candidatus Bathyarchaeia archaeon]
MSTVAVEAVAPATSANLGSGFDVFSVALDVFHDSVCVEMIEKNRVEISVEGLGAASIPVAPEQNTAGIVAKALLENSKSHCGIRMKIRKGVRPGSGLGSSAASAAAAAVAINELLDLGLSKIELIGFAAKGEVASAGAAHADNVSSAILGGFTIVRSYHPLDVISLSLPENVGFAVAIPDLHFSTGLARSVLPKKVDLSNMTYNVGHAAAIVAGVALNDINMIGKGMSDSVVEPARARLIPGLSEVKRRALEAGAVGVAISGAGPSVLALVNIDEASSANVAEAMRRAFESHNIECEAICAKPGPGARVVRKVEC